MRTSGMQRVEGWTSILLIALALCALGRPARAEFQRILGHGDLVPKFGRIGNATSGNGQGPDGRACLSEDGAIVTRSDAGELTGLVCIDGDGPRAIVRVGDPAPGGGVFAGFGECQFIGASDVLFWAYARRTLTDAQVDYAVYRAGANGLERVAAPSDFLDLTPEPQSDGWLINFAASANGALAVHLHNDQGSRLFVSNAGSLHPISGYFYDMGSFARLDRGDVVFIASREESRQAILAWRDGKLRTLAQAGDVSSAGDTYERFALWERRGDHVILWADLYRSYPTPPPPFGPRQLLLYDAASGSLHEIDESHPAWADTAAVAAQISAQYGNQDNEDITLLDYNSAGTALIVSEDPGSGDLLTNLPPTTSACPPNDALSDTPPVLPTLVPTPTPSPSPTATRVHVDPITLEVVANQAAPGEELEVRVILRSGRVEVAGVQIDIGADEPLAIITNDRGPACTRNPAINKDHTVFAFLAGGPDMRALVLSLTNIDPIPDDSLLFSCRLRVAADAAPGRYQLRLHNLGGSTADGDAIDTFASGGSVTVVDPSSRAVEPDAGASSTSAGGCSIDSRRDGGAGWGPLAIAVALWTWRRSMLAKRGRCQVADRNR